MKYISVLACYFILFCSHSQNHQLIDTTDYKKREALIKQFKAKHELFNKQLKTSYKGKIRKEVLNFYKESNSQFLEIIENKKLLFEKGFQNYIDSLCLKLKQKNPKLKNENISLYLAKNPSPNAFNIGDGTIILNIGLFSFFQNEYQLLSVISHEVAHQVLEHSKKSIEKRAHINTSVLSSSSNTSRSIKTGKYKRGTRSFNLLKDLLYADGEDRRQHEIEADSLGYILYRNMNLPKTEFTNALLLLKKYDSVPAIMVDSTIYTKLFDIPKQPFESHWLKNEDFKDYNYEFYKSKMDLDSLKDHPEIEERITKLKASFLELNSDTKSTQLPLNNSFNNLNQIAKQSSPENLYYLNEYGLSIYLILNRLETNFNGANHAYYKKWLGINFEAIHEAKKRYQLNRYVDRLAPNEQSLSYQRFLNFIWNLNLNEIKTIADYYNKS
ncbi:M48 family metalloprotease [Flavivirga rizhaonensis]|uniref:Peptidase M48 n=1 Tax=Flavivirga rizhaonensis TaxID=2559571 RepID=A0A4S1E223_9FLAO|nr:M48 family metalloprotease [Flavivirga rizhaonensis]TGV04393.1 peptidase M48 [Flavivirga rizhaonensis]